MRLLNIGQTVHLEFSGLPCVIRSFVDGGGQGEVYQGVLPTGTKIAVKWYSQSYLQKDPRLRNRLTDLINLEFPYEEFIWPFDLTLSPQTPGFGYAMPWREARFVGVDELMNAAEQPTFRILTRIAFNIATAFNTLHSDSRTGGRCYRDISASNVCADPGTGEIRIHDNDNVDITGTPGPMQGTQGYKAPEVVLRLSHPNTLTDLHSLAVILFRLLLVDHPLEGEKENLLMGDLDRLYGSEPVFIFDPTDASNRPIPGVHATAPVFWPKFPRFIRDLFTQAFTAGLRTPHKRILGSQWRAAFVRLHDSIFECGCGAENFYDQESWQSSKHLGDCWHCQRTLMPPSRMILDDNLERIVMLTSKTELFRHHILKSDYDLSRPLARVLGNADGLENLSLENWHVRRSDGSSEQIQSGQVAPLDSNIRIHFGRVTARVKKQIEEATD